MNPQRLVSGAVAGEPLVGNGGAGDVAAQEFEFLALMGTTTDCRDAQRVTVPGRRPRRRRPSATPPNLTSLA
jgi:hypothetical protein